jgi:hypothetical protein
MKFAILVVCVILTGCADIRSHFAAPAPHRVDMSILTASCPVDPPAPAPLPKLRTIEEIAQWALKEDRARDRAVADLEVCREQLIEVENWAREELSAHN